MYEALKAALLASDIPFTEYAWRPAPPAAEAYGIITPDGQGSALWADGEMTNQSLSGSIDLYCKHGGMSEVLSVQLILSRLGVSFYYNSCQFESATRLVHHEIIFELEVLS